MPQATDTHTPNPVIVAPRLPSSSGMAAHWEPAPPSYQDAILREACRSAMVTYQATTALVLSVAELPPDDLRREAVNVAMQRLQPLWHDQVEQACTVPASGPSGLRDKAALLDLLIERNEDGSVSGSPALSLAASLAADLLQQHGPASY